MKHEVKYQVFYRVIIEADNQQDLEDAICDIEPGDGEYVENSFEVIKVKEL